MNFNITETLEIVTRGGERLRDKVLSVPEGARLVREATNNEHWGPSGTDMSRIADMTHNFKDFGPIMQTLWERFTENSPLGAGKNWRNIYKALLLLDYLLRNGSEKVVNEARQNSWEIKELARFHYIDPEGVDRGVSIRERAKQVVDLIHDTQRLREERKKSRSVRDKFNQSISSGQELWDSQSYHRNRNKKDDWDGEWGTGMGGTNPSSKTDYADSSDEEKEKSEDDGFASLREPKKVVQKSNPPPSKVWNPFDNNNGPNTTAENDDWADFTQAPPPTSHSGDLGSLSFPPPRATNPSFQTGPPSQTTGISLISSPAPNSIGNASFGSGASTSLSHSSIPVLSSNILNLGNPSIGNPSIGTSLIGNPSIGNSTIGQTIGNATIGNSTIGQPIGNATIGQPSNTRTRTISGSSSAKPVIDKTDPWANPHLFDLSAISDASTKNTTPVTNQHIGQNMFRTEPTQPTVNFGSTTGYVNYPTYALPTGIYGYPPGYGTPTGY